MMVCTERMSQWTSPSVLAKVSDVRRIVAPLARNAASISATDSRWFSGKTMESVTAAVKKNSRT